MEIEKKLTALGLKLLGAADTSGPLYSLRESRTHSLRRR